MYTNWYYSTSIEKLKCYITFRFILVINNYLSLLSDCSDSTYDEVTEQCNNCKLHNVSVYYS